MVTKPTHRVIQITMQKWCKANAVQTEALQVLSSPPAGRQRAALNEE